MKQIRKEFLEIKEGFLDAKSDRASKAFLCANIIFIQTVWLTICYISTIFMICDLAYIAYVIVAATLIVNIFFCFNSKAFNLVIPYSSKILLFLFGRYGRVVTKEDWKKIKKQNRKLYKYIWSKDALGCCYFCSWVIALYLQDAKLMYCSIETRQHERTAHAVIVKNDCVYCTNGRMHFDLEEYNKLLKVEVYQIYAKEEYNK